MKKYYRNRFILGAMLAYVILFVIVIGAITVSTYFQMDREANQFLSAMLSREQNEAPAFSQEPTPPIFGYQQRQRPFPTSFYDITADEEGEILSWNRFGTFEEDEASVRQHASEIIDAQLTAGKIGSYQFAARWEEDGQIHLILMDNSIQIQTIYNVGKSALLVGLLLMLLLFIILLPVSSKVADAFARNAESQKQFITDAGHELKTPVAVIRSNLDVMELLDGKSKWSGNIRGQVDRLEGLIKQLLLLSRLDEKQSTGKTEIIDFTQMLRNELNIYQEEAAQKELTLNTDIQNDLRLTGDKDALLQLLHAVLDNAIQYTPAHGSVWVQCAREKKMLHMDITNTVEALPQIAPERLTDRFTRGDTARSRKNGGTGIGLSTARSVAEMHHGSIKVNYLTETMFQLVILLPITG